LRELEPHARGLKAIHVPGASVVDYRAVALAFAETIQRRGGTVRTGARVRRLQRREGLWRVETTGGDVSARWLVTCGGLHADRLTAMAEGSSDLQIVPFRGEYYDVVPSRRSLVNGMIYPVPDPALPFLGVHFTRTIAGGVHAGPNAVLALKREGYRKRDVSCRDIWSLLCHAGFWKMARKYWWRGLDEWFRSLSKGACVRALQRLVPEIRSPDLVPAMTGVRAQAVDASGALLDDFDIALGDHAIHVRNVPSPAATASISVGSTIVERAASRGFCGPR
jgi:L-2-hydroxyglutarate oxidase